MTDKQKAYFEALGFEPKGNEKKLREAYDRAHEIRKFEIEMYWRRSSYMWTLQAAALAGLALIMTQSDLSPWSCAEEIAKETKNCVANRVQITVAAGVWAFGAFSAYLWLLLLRGAKYWQNNWERHLDILEDHFSGALYKTYPATKGKAPYSVTKLNELMALFMFILWLTIGALATALLTTHMLFMLVAAVVVALVVFLTWCFDDRLRMTDYPKLSTTGSSDLRQETKLEVSRRQQPVFRERSDDANPTQR